MSELVQKHIESLMTEELDELRRTQLFTADEIKPILKRRKEFELKINGLTKHLDDFKEYIEYERLLLRQIQCRRDKHKIGEGSIDYIIRQRIKSIYEIGLQRFPNDFSFWLSYFEYCKAFNQVGLATEVLQSMIKQFPSKPEVWHIAAKFHSHDQQDDSAAIQMLLKGLSIHKDNKLLYREAIQLEISKVSNKNGPDEDIPEEALKERRICCRKIAAHLKSVFEKIDDYTFLIEILNSLEPFSFTIQIQGALIERLVSYYSEQALVWHNIAQREMRGLHHSSKGESMQCSTVSYFNFCTEKYKEGLGKVNDANKVQLWYYYLDFLIHRQQDKSTGSNKTLKLLRKAFEEASQQRVLDEKYYIVWLEFVEKEKAPVILKKATVALPDSAELWRLRLRFSLLQGDEEGSKRIFKLGVLALKEKALALWEMMILNAQMTLTHDVVISIFEDAVKQPEEISKVLKPEYIDWLYLTFGIRQAREAYMNLVHQRPYCRALHNVMDKCETLEIESNLDAWERIHQLACNQFGENDETVWLDYINFLLGLEKNDNRNKNVKRVYKCAIDSLSPLLKYEFNKEYQKLLSNQN